MKGSFLGPALSKSTKDRLMLLGPMRADVVDVFFVRLALGSSSVRRGCSEVQLGCVGLVLRVESKTKMMIR